MTSSAPPTLDGPAPNFLRMKLICGGVMLVALVLDLWTKSYMQELLGLWPDVNPAPHTVEIIPGFLRWEGTWNPGVTFGLGAGHTVAILVLTGLATLGLIIWFLGSRTPSKLLHVGLALIIAGALGNLYDRVEWHKVRDWIGVYIEAGGGEKKWPNFNIADMGIVIGVGLIIWDNLFGVSAKIAKLQLEEAKRRKAAKAAKGAS